MREFFPTDKNNVKISYYYLHYEAQRAETISGTCKISSAKHIIREARAYMRITMHSAYMREPSTASAFEGSDWIYGPNPWIHGLETSKEGKR